MTRPMSNAPELELFFDGGCPLCRREVAMLRRWDKRAAIRFTDIDSPDFCSADCDKTHAELMSQMHARAADGTWLRGMEVFRRLYAIVGFKRLVWLSRLPGLAQLLNGGYALFAKNRLRLTGRCSAETCGVKHAGERVT